MKNFYEATVIKQTAKLPVTCNNGTVLINDIVSDSAPLLETFTVTIENYDLDTVVYVDGNEIYPKFKSLAQHSAQQIRFTITPTFYSWLHTATGRGWILYDHSTY